MTLKTQCIEEKFDKFDLMKIGSFCSSEDPRKRMKRQVTKREETLVSHVYADLCSEHWCPVGTRLVGGAPWKLRYCLTTMLYAWN